MRNTRKKLKHVPHFLQILKKVNKMILTMEMMLKPKLSKLRVTQITRWITNSKWWMINLVRN